VEEEGEEQVMQEQGLPFQIVQDYSEADCMAFKHRKRGKQKVKSSVAQRRSERLNKDRILIQMSILVWNVRGLNLKERRDVIGHTYKYSPPIVGLLETKVKENKSFRILKCLPYGWSHLNNYSRP